MKYKVELDNLLSAIRYCAAADNNNDFWERWDRLKVTEQLEVLANVTFFDDWQTNEQREFSLYRAEKANAECREIDELLAPFWDNTPETTESRYLVGQWAGIQMHILGEMHELREYIRATKEPEKTQGQKEIEFLHRVIALNEQKRNTQQMTSSPATEPEQDTEPEFINNTMKVTEWLTTQFGNPKDARIYLDDVERSPYLKTQKARAVIRTFINSRPKGFHYDNNPTELAKRFAECTGIELDNTNFSNYIKDLESLNKDRNNQ